MTDGKLAGRVSVITGGANGIGKETAHVLASHGSAIIVADILGDGAARVAKSIRDAGGKAQAFELDVRDESQIEAMVTFTLDKYGRVDVLHNNAVLHTVEQRKRDLDVCNIDAQTWLQAMTVNALGPLLCSKHVIPHMIEQGSGALVHMSSGFGLLGDVTLTSYGMSKAALQLMSASIAVQYGKQGIRSNVIACGMVLTDMAKDSTPDALKEIIVKEHCTPHLGSPKQIADVVAFLASDEAAFVTGHVLAADGGFTSHSPASTPLREYLHALGSV